MFQGASSLNLDAGGRLFMPVRYRDVLSATSSGQLTATQHPHGRLMIFPHPESERLRACLAPTLRSAARIMRAAVLLVMGDHFELWDAQTDAAQEAEATKGERPLVFEDFSF